MGHWYTTKGKPRHTVKGKPTTLRHARTMELFPSVTTVLDIQSKPQLVTWLQGQLFDACSSAVADGMDLATNKSVVFQNAKSVGKEAAERGTLVHNAIEEYLEGGKVDKRLEGMCVKVVDYVREHFGEIQEFEYSFTDTEYGYGGCIDIVGEDYILDFKTKDFQPGANPKKFVYDSHVMQLAAYDKAVRGGSRLINLFINVNDNHFGEVLPYVWSQEDAKRAWWMYYNLLHFWQLSKKYGPLYEDLKQTWETEE